MYIYAIENLINGKIYVGKTSKSSVYDRWRTHLYDCKRYKTRLYNSINHHGAQNFIIYQLESTGSVSRERLNERERYWIEILEPDYNMTRGGDGGLINDQTGKRWKIKDTTRMQNKKTITEKVLAGRQKTSGSNNYQSKYLIHTPWGTFHTWRDCVTEAKKLKIEGVSCIVTDEYTLRKYCMQDTILNKEGRRTPPEWRGRSTRELGFYIEEKHEQD